MVAPGSYNGTFGFVANGASTPTPTCTSP